MKPLVLLAVLGLAAGPRASFAQWSPDPTVNTLVPNPVVAPFNLANALVMRFGADGFVAYRTIYTKEVLPGSSVLITRSYAVGTHIDAGGLPTVHVNLGWTAAAPPPLGGHVPLADGGYIAAHLRLEEPIWIAMAARIRSNGTVSWGKWVIDIAGNGADPAIAPDGQGGAIVAWRHSDFNVNDDIYAQRFDGSGNRLWSGQGRVVATVPGSQRGTAIATDAVGGAIVAWIDGRTAPSQVYAQRIDPSGTALWAAGGIALAPAPGQQTGLRLAADGLGGAVAVWLDERAGARHVYAQRIDPSGVPQWAPTGVPVATAADVTRLAVASDGGGRVFAAWQDARAGTPDVYVQRLDSSGAVWTAGGVSVSPPGDFQGVPSVDADGSGGALVAWEDTRSGNSDIYAQHLDGSGKPLWVPGGREVCTNPATQTAPSITSDGKGGGVVAWRNQRDQLNPAIYIQRVYADGSLPVTLQRFSVE